MKFQTRRFPVSKMLIVVFLTLNIQVFFASSQIISYGPSIEELTHRPLSSSSPPSGFHVDQAKRNKSVIFLSDFVPSLSVLVPLLPGKSWANQSEAITNFENIRHGEFDVRAPPNFGVIAVVQFLNLATIYGTKPTKCLDYLFFSDNDSPETDDSIKICGEISNTEDSIRQPRKLVGPRTFIAPSGNLTVKMFLVSMLIQSEWRTNGGPEKQIAVEIAFTAFPLWSSKSTSISHEFVPDKRQNKIKTFSGCPSFTLSSDGIQIRDQNQSQLANGPKLIFWRCSKYVENSCIHRRLFCDQIVHCGFPRASNSDSISLFGQDEINCDPDSNSNDYDDYFYTDDYFDLTSNSTGGNETQVKKFHEGQQIFNGTRRFVPIVVKRHQSWNVELSHGIVIFSVLIFLLVFICWLFVCIRRIWHSKFASFVQNEDGKENKRSRKMHETEIIAEMYKKRQSVFMIMKERNNSVDTQKKHEM